MNRIDQIRARVKGATKGPWMPEEVLDYNLPTGFGYVINESGDSVLGEADSTGQLCDVEFMAHAREDVPYLLTKLDEARRIIDAAPHEPDCRVWDGALPGGAALPCDCWKADALRRLEE